MEECGGEVMIEISATVRRPASRIDKISTVELEVLYLIHTRGQGKEYIDVRDLDSHFLVNKTAYPILNTMDIRQRRWWFGHVLIEMKAEKTSKTGQVWRLKNNAPSV